MRVRHRGHEPQVDDSAYVAPTAVLIGDVRIAAGVRVLHGAVLTSEDGHVTQLNCAQLINRGPAVPRRTRYPMQGVGWRVIHQREIEGDDRRNCG